MAVRSKTKEVHNISPFLDNDENFKRMQFVRYADDCLIGVIGSKEDCIEIKRKISEFLSTKLLLNVNLEKTLITQACTDSAYFLGYYVKITPHEKKPIVKVRRGDVTYKARINTKPQLIAPIVKILYRLKQKGLVRIDNKTKTVSGTCYNLYTQYDDATIVKYLYGL